MDLQQARHEADYDQVRAFTRSEVLTNIARAEMAIRGWRSVRSHPVAEAYLVALLLNTRRS